MKMDSLATPVHESETEHVDEISFEEGEDKLDNELEEPEGEPYQSVANAPKVKLEITSGPLPPVQNYEPLPYGRRKRRLENDENAPKRVKFILSSKRIHPGTKSNNILLEPLAEIRDQVEPRTAAESDDYDEDKPLMPKYRRRNRRVPSDEVPLSMTPSASILDAFEEAYDDDDGFTTIKDLAERNVTKLEPLDYDNFYYDDDIGGGDEEEDEDNTGDVKLEALDDIKEEPLDFEDEESQPLKTRSKKKKAAPKKKKPVKDSDKEEAEEDIENEEETSKPVVKTVKKRKKKKKDPSGTGGAGYDQKQYNCMYCEYSAQKREWLGHLKKEHADKNLVFCPLKKCQKPFESETEMRQHEQNSHIKNICTFEGCGKEFKFKSVLREHRKTHYPADCDWMADPDPDMTIDRFFVCTYCGKRYRTRSGWRAHEAYVHTKQLDFHCDEEGCGKAFFSENDLNTHKRKHSGELPFTCSYCGNRYISAHSLAQHEKAAHLQTEDVECEVCNKKVRKRNLPAHVKTHSEFKGLPCQFCNKEFPTIGSLKRHEKIHTECKEHKCRFCGKGFVQKANMQSHERIHTGERPYKCQYCNEGFVQSTRRRQHEATCKMRHLC